MRKVSCILLGLGLMIFFSGVSFAAEHPAHGVAPGKSLKEHHGAAAEHPGEKSVLSAADVIKGIKDHIDGMTTANNGLFPIDDPVDGKALSLKLVKVHEDKVSYLKKDDAYFACTDFATGDGKTMYDLDFWMKNGAGDKLEVYQTKIHKKDGTPRFTYKDDEIAPVE